MIGKREDWHELVQRYSFGRAICNCGQAWLTNCGKGSIPQDDGSWKWVSDLPSCQYGCSANQIAAKYEIGTRVLAEIKVAERSNPGTEEG